MKTRISVVIPVYNSEMTVVRAIKSVFEQTGIQYIKEIIIVDDGSTDNSLELIKKMSEKSTVTYKVITQKNCGVSCARNVGINASTSEWIAFLDADDYWKKEKIAEQMNYIKLYPEIHFLCTATDKLSMKYGEQLEANLLKINVILSFMLSRIVTSSVMSRRVDIKSEGSFKQGISYAEDQNLFMKIIAQHGAYYIKKPLTVCDDKLSFGEKGLSANLLEMHKGVMLNVDELRSLGHLTTTGVFFLKTIEVVKYYRRVAMTFIRKAARKC